MASQKVFTYILSQENTYRTTPVPIVDGYEWNMYKHVKLTTLYLNSRYESGNEDDKPFKNIILDKMNLQHRAINFDVKDIQPFVNDPKNYFKSFLVQKYHEIWARKVGLGVFFNELGETYCDYGGVLVKKLPEDARPVVMPFQQLAFVDQTNMTSAPICEKVPMTPAELKDAVAKLGWDRDQVDMAILKSEENAKKSTQTGQGQSIKTPGKFIEVYLLEGVMPADYMYTKPDYALNTTDYFQQFHVVAFYQNDNGDKEGLCFYQGKAKGSSFKATVRDAIYGRALGRGGVEELFEDQVWVNYGEIQQKEMLDQASKILYQTADKKYTTRNKTSEMDNGEILTHEPNMPLSQVNTQAVNMPAFENATKKWEEHAKAISSAYDSIAGDDPKSGMPFRLGLLLNQEAHSIHKYRKEKLGLFINEIYRDWILPEFQKELSNKKEFMSLLSLEEMQKISEAVVTNAVNQKIAELVLDGKIVSTEDIEQLQQSGRELFYKSGNKKFFALLEDELKTLPMDVDVITTGEQKNTALISEKLSSIFSQVMQVLQAAPDFFVQHPEMAAIFNEILEASGVSPMSYGVARPVGAPKIAQPTLPAQSVPVEKSAAPVASPTEEAALPVV